MSECGAQPDCKYDQGALTFKSRIRLTPHEARPLRDRALFVHASKKCMQRFLCNTNSLIMQPTSLLSLNRCNSSLNCWLHNVSKVWLAAGSSGLLSKLNRAGVDTVFGVRDPFNHAFPLQATAGGLWDNKWQ